MREKNFERWKQKVTIKAGGFSSLNCKNEYPECLKATLWPQMVSSSEGQLTDGHPREKFELMKQCMMSKLEVLEIEPGG